MVEAPFSFKNDMNVTLRGIVHIPANVGGTTAYRKGVNIIVAGIKYRVAPNRLSVKIARRLCEDGWYVIRWDPSGIGESDGDLGSGRREKDIFYDIQKGLFVNDTIAATEFLREKYNLSEIVHLGNCGGAVTALLSHHSAAVRKLILIDLPIVYSRTTQAFNNEALRGGAYSDKIFRGYLAKIFSINSWKRFLSFKSSYNVIYRLLKKNVANKIPLIRKLLTRNYVASIPEYTDTNEKINMPLFDSFTKFMNNKASALFVCAQFDKSTPLLEKYFLSYYYMKYSEGQALDAITKITIPNANHIYTDIESQEKLLQQIRNWLSKQS